MKKVLLGPIAVSCLLLLVYACKHKTDEPQVTAPANLIYTPNSLSTPEGTAANSATPTVQGNTPITYTLSTNPDAGANISINGSTGVISVTSALSAGSYSVSVSAKNSAGTTQFPNAYTVNVSSSTKVTFDADIDPIIKASCSPCHVSGGNNTDYTVFSSSRTNVDFIINRIKRNQGTPGFMPQGGSKLSAANIAKIEQWKTDGLLEN